MITIVCTHCSHALRVTSEVAEADQLVGTGSSFHPDGYNCYHCEKSAMCVLSAEISELAEQALTVYEVTAQEAFAALNGMGIPAEYTCCTEVLENLFQKHGLKLKGRQMEKTARYVVDSITFPDGTVVHLGASFNGALAYRITKQHSYVRAVEKLHVD